MPLAAVNAFVGDAPNFGVLGSPVLLLLDLFASVSTAVAYRAVETRPVSWWRSLVVFFLAYQGVTLLERRVTTHERCPTDPAVGV